MNIYSVIMAGGGGTRFWPLSRQAQPKQILNLSGKDIMINETIKRNSSFTQRENVFIVTNKNQKEILRKVILEDIEDKNILLEPIGKNTAACIGYAAVVINKRYGDSIMCVLPSDAYISNNENYSKVLSAACICAENTKKIVTIGVKPIYPSTGYGYIKYGDLNNEYGAYEVKEFVEKPVAEVAESYISQGNYFWNCGIFVLRVSVILDNIKRFLPKLYKQLKYIEKYIDTEDQEEVIRKVYDEIQSISVDYGILERSDDVLVVPGDFGWNDIGSWEALGAMFPTDGKGNIVRGEHVGIDTYNTIIYGNKLITTIGIDNMIVVSTDDATLICPKNRAQEVKKIVDLLKVSGKEKYA